MLNLGIRNDDDMTYSWVPGSSLLLWPINLLVHWATSVLNLPFPYGQLSLGGTKTVFSDADAPPLPGDALLQSL